MKFIKKKFILVLIFNFLLLSSVFAITNNKDYSLNYTFYENFQIFGGKVFFLEKGNLYKNYINTNYGKSIIDYGVQKDGNIILVMNKNGKFFIKNGDKKSILYDNISNLTLDGKGNYYFIGMKNNKYFVVKNNDKISKEFNFINKLVIGGGNYFITVNYKGKQNLYKNNILLFTANNIKNLKFNNINKKIYYIFEMDYLRGISSDKKLLISNYTNPEIIYSIKNFVFSSNGVGIVYDFNIDKEPYYKTKIWGDKKILNKAYIYNDSVQIKNDINISLYYKGSYSKKKLLFSNDKDYKLLKNAWDKEFNKNYDNLNSYKLDLLSKKVINSIGENTSISRKKSLIYLSLIIRDSSYKYSIIESMKKENTNISIKDFNSMKMKDIGFEYEPTYYEPTGIGIKINGIKKTYEKDTNRFLLEVDYELDQNFPNKVSGYFWWKSSNGKFLKVKGNESYSKVYFYPESVEPTNDYRISLNGGDNIGFVDRKSFVILKDKFIYKKVDLSKVNTFLNVVNYNKIMFLDGAYTFSINAYEEEKGVKTPPTNVNVFISSVDGKKIDNKLLYSGNPYYYSNNNYLREITFLTSSYSLSNIKNYIGKEIEITVDGLFNNTKKTTKFNIIILPQFIISGKLYGAFNDIKQKIIINNDKQILLGYNDEFSHYLSNKNVSDLYYSFTGTKNNFNIPIELSVYGNKYSEYPLIKTSLSFFNPKPFIVISGYTKDEKIIKFSSILERAFFRYKKLHFTNKFIQHKIIKLLKEMIDKKVLDKKVLDNKNNYLLLETQYLINKEYLLKK